MSEATEHMENETATEQEALDTPEQAAGTIVSTLKKGYVLHDRVLRPAMVTVAKAVQ